MSDTLQIRGIQPLSWGTTVIDGYVNESQGEDETTGEHLIDDEGGDVVCQITGFGLKADVTLEVIPKSSVTPPVASDIFNYGDKSITILGIMKKRIKKDVEKWTIKGNRFPGVSLSEGP